MSTPTGSGPPSDDVWGTPPTEGPAGPATPPPGHPTHSGQPGFPPASPLGYPPAGPQPGWVQGPRNGLGVASLVLGILSLPGIFLFGIGGIVLGLIGLILGVLGLGRARRGEANNRGTAIAGAVLSALGLLLGIAVLSWLVVVGTRYVDCFDLDTYPTEESRNACIDRVTEENRRR